MKSWTSIPALAGMLILVSVVTEPQPIIAQQPVAGQHGQRVANPEGLHHSRQDLEDLIAQLEQTAESPRANQSTRQEARASAARIRQRLQEGDFRAGDRIDLNVRGEPDMTGEFTVEPGRTITLPNVGAIPLIGVLRSELEDHLRRELSRYLQNPSVQARSMIRLAIVGEVGSPGFYTLPASLLMEDVVMTAGGPTRSANLDRIRIERAGEVVWRDGTLQQAMLDSRTLDQLSLQAGDRIVVPSRPAPPWRTALTVLTTAGSLLWLYRRIR
jgi:protein involved in polysaccharide export with SLBB domain